MNNLTYLPVSTARWTGKIRQALGLQDYDIKGKLALHLNADGRYAKGQNPKRFTKDIIITSIPAFDLRSSFAKRLF
jgi:AsmA protein